MSATTAWRGTNVARVAGFNFAVLLDAIRRSPAGLSRVELTSATGLSAQAVSNIARRGLDSGLLVEGEREQPSGIGKPRTPLRLNPDGVYAVGVHLDPHAITYVIVDLAGHVVARATEPLDLAAKPADVLTAVARRIERLVKSSGIPREKIAGVGFASPGPVDLATGTIVAPPHLPLWRDVHVTQELGRLTNWPVVLDKDVAAAAVGERWAGLTMDANHSTYLFMSTGIGTGIITGGSVLRGLTGNAGDVGHLSVDSSGPDCPCGLRGCLAGVLAPRGILGDAVEAGLFPPAAISDEDQDALLTRLVTEYQEGVPAAASVIDRAAQRLAIAVRTIANITDCEVVAIGGNTWVRLAPALEPLLMAHLDPIARGELAPLQIVSSVTEDAAAIGTACLVLDAAFIPSTETIAL